MNQDNNKKSKPIKEEERQFGEELINLFQSMIDEEEDDEEDDYDDDDLIEIDDYHYDNDIAE